MVDVSIIITFHNEKAVAYQTLSAVARMRAYASAHGISSDLVTVFDRADKMTKEFVNRHSDFREQGCILEVDHGDLGLSRNDGIKASEGKIICIIDGDDYYSKNWVERSVQTLSQLGSKAIIHPEMIVSFGTQNSYSWQIDQGHRTFDVHGLLANNYWTSCVSSWREVFEGFPYKDTRPALTGFGYEDWHWNCETIAAGYKHCLAKDTVAFYRRKRKSMLTEQNRASMLMPATTLFNPGILNSISKQNPS